MSAHRWHLFPDAESVAQAAAQALGERILAVLAERESCHVALPGGTTPAACLRLLAQQDLPWARIHWYLGDERCLPAGDPERNDILIRDCLWSRIPVPQDNCHPIRAELGAIAAATEYAELIQQIGRLDVVLLGMGEDGHTASLFPGNPALALSEPVVPVLDAPKPPPERVSLSVPTLQAASVRLVLITGSGKQAAAAQLRADAPLPINRVGELDIYADRAAAP